MAMKTLRSGDTSAISLRMYLLIYNWHFAVESLLLITQRQPFNYSQFRHTDES